PWWLWVPASAGTTAARFVPRTLERTGFPRKRGFARTNGEHIEPETALSRRSRAQMLDQLARIGRQLGEAADADGELTHRPGVGERDHCDRHGARDAMRRRLRHDPDSHVALDEAANRVEAAQLHTQAQRPPARSRLLGQESLQRAGPVETDKIVVQHLRNRDLAAPREQMVAPDHEHEA